MSRHRIVKGLNLEDELDDQAIDSGDEGAEEWDDMDDDQHAQMESGVSAVHSVLGISSSITDRDIKEALWNYFFDVESSIAFLLDAQHKKEAAKARANEPKPPKKAKGPAPLPPKSSRPSTPGVSTPKVKSSAKAASTSTLPAGPVSQLRADLDGMNLLDDGDDDMAVRSAPPTPVVSIAKEKILEEVRKNEFGDKPVLSLVVVGHVDAGKSTLMGRVLHELGVLSDRALESNQRQSQKMGKGSFAYAWTFDATDEERERGVTIDVAIDGFETATKRFTLIDAPGHRDFIPNMISGAAQADTAVLVVDGASGAFERGFEGDGQTREHAVLVRSLGVQQLVVAINKLDAVGWAQARFENIRDQLRPFLTQTGFQPSNVSYIPVGATSGENLVERSNAVLNAWYEGRTLVEQLDALSVPPRALDAPLRIPVSNVFRGQTATSSGLAVAGRIESGIVQIGERLACLPGDESGVVRSLEVDGVSVPWAVAGANVTIFLSGIDPLQLSVGSLLCPPSALPPVVSSFFAQIMVFDLKFPITVGSAVELFHHSKDIPATISSLEAVLDKTTGAILKSKPRMLTKGMSARIGVTLRTLQSAGGRKLGIPLETFSVNKSMGRVLFRRAGETIAAGIVLEVTP